MQTMFSHEAFRDTTGWFDSTKLQFHKKQQHVITAVNVWFVFFDRHTRSYELVLIDRNPLSHHLQNQYLLYNTTNELRTSSNVPLQR